MLTGLLLQTGAVATARHVASTQDNPALPWPVFSTPTYIKASDTGLGDQFGRAVAVSGDTFVTGAWLEDGAATNAGAAYVFVRAGLTWAQQGYLQASNAGAGDGFGTSVAIFGDTLVVGAPTEDGPTNASVNAGAAYVFVRANGVWTEQAYLRGATPAAGNSFGTSVAIWGSTIVVGAPGDDGAGADAGAAYVFVRSGTTWTQQAVLRGTGLTAGDSLGRAVAAAQDTVIAGAPFRDGSGADAGAAFVFTRSAGVWSQQAVLTSSTAAAGDTFGWTVGLSGDTAVVGSPLDDTAATNAGAADVFTRTGASWAHAARLQAPAPGESDRFGYSVSLAGAIVAVGAPDEDGSGAQVNPAHDDALTGAGAAYVFARGAGNWQSHAYVKAHNPGASDAFGFAVAIWGEDLMVGATMEDGGDTGVDPPYHNIIADSGAAYLYRVAAATSVQAALPAEVEWGDFLGDAVAVSGDTVVVGAPGEAGSGTGVNPPVDNLAGELAGAAFVFERQGAGWVQQAYLKAPVRWNSQPEFGSAVAVSGDTIVVGSPVTPGPEFGSGYGEAYVYVRSGETWAYQATLRPSNPGREDLFGSAVAISGDTIVVGAPTEDGAGEGVNPPDSNTRPNAGAAYVFVRTGTSWTQQAYLKPLNSNSSAYFGLAVAIHGDVVAIGAPGDYSVAGGAGAVSVYRRSGSTWTHEAFLTALNAGALDHFGNSVALADGLLAVGAPYEDGSGAGVQPPYNDSMPDAGAVYLFRWNGLEWAEDLYLKAPAPASFERFGMRVALDGDFVAAGAPWDSRAGLGLNPTSAGSVTEAGAVHAFRRAGSSWVPHASVKPTDRTIVRGLFGFAVGLDQGRMVTGTPELYRDTTPGTPYVYDLATLPDAPVVTDVTAGDGQVTVPFVLGGTGGGQVSNVEYSLDDGVTFHPRSPASTTSPLVLTGLTNGTTSTVRVRAISTVGTGAMSDGHLTQVGLAPQLTQSPAAATVKAGAPAQFTATASGAPAPTYQWQVSTNAGGSWQPVPAEAPYTGTTSATLAIAAAPVDWHGRQYRVVASNTLGSTTSAPVALTVRGDASLSPASLRLAVAKDGPVLTAVTGTTTITVAFAGASTNWSASSNVSWLQVESASGSGPGLFTISVTNPGDVIGAASALTGTITVATPDAPAPSVTLPVDLTVVAATSSPFGQVDTPDQDATDVQGAIGITGWALDDIGVAAVTIYRECLPFDNPASCQDVLNHRLVFLGDAAFVSGARPDVAALFSSYPAAHRAGWGLMILSPMLPHVSNGLAFGGQGALSLYAVATDVEGRRVLLGRTTNPADPAFAAPTRITMSNDTIAKPFGVIDTPAQGATVSGIIANAGWVLTPDSDTSSGNGDIQMPTTGVTLTLFLDGLPITQLTYNQCRGSNLFGGGSAMLAPTTYCDDDVASIFGHATPQAPFTSRPANATRFRNLDAGRGAIASTTIDTRLLSNGAHTLAWSATDSQGRTEGIGSRFIMVLNSTTDSAATLAPPAIATLPQATADTQGVWYRTGFDLAERWHPLPGGGGASAITLPVGGRLEVWMGASIDAAYLVTDTTLQPLPGASLEGPRLAWVPPVAFVGTYELAIVRGAETIRFAVTVR